MKIEHYEKLNNTPAVKIAVEGWNEMLVRGVAREVVMVQWDSNALVAFHQNDLLELVPAGVIIYAHLEWAREMHINIGYVRPAFRRQGVYRELWAALVARAQEKNVAYIEGSTAMDNEEVRATARSLGREERGVLLGFKVPPPLPPVKTISKGG